MEFIPISPKEMMKQSFAKLYRLAPITVYSLHHYISILRVTRLWVTRNFTLYVPSLRKFMDNISAKNNLFFCFFKRLLHNWKSVPHIKNTHSEFINTLNVKQI
jgi:hypothetical protein